MVLDWFLTTDRDKYFLMGKEPYHDKLIYCSSKRYPNFANEDSFPKGWEEIDLKFIISSSQIVHGGLSEDCSQLEAANTRYVAKQLFPQRREKSFKGTSSSKNTFESGVANWPIPPRGSHLHLQCINTSFLSFSHADTCLAWPVFQRLQMLPRPEIILHDKHFTDC